MRKTRTYAMELLFLMLVTIDQNTGAERRNVVAENVHPLVCPILAHAGNKEIKALSMAHHLRLECDLVEAQQGGDDGE